MLLMPIKTSEVSEVKVLTIKDLTNMATSEKALILIVNKCSNSP